MTATPPHINPDPHDDFDRNLTQTLHALGHAEPAPGLADRLLRALEPPANRPADEAARPFYKHSPTSAHTLDRKLLSTVLPKFVISTGADLGQRSGETTVFRPGPHYGLIGGALALCAATLLLLVPANHARKPQQPPRSQPSPSITQATNPGAPSSPAASSPVKVGLLPPTVAPPTPLQPTALHVHLELTLTRPPTDNPTNPDQQALADLHIPSFPAPPLPPTAQERLVRLMLRHGETRDLAQLDPAFQAAFAAEEQVDRQIFFDPPHPDVAAESARLDKVWKATAFTDGTREIDGSPGQTPAQSSSTPQPSSTPKARNTPQIPGAPK